MTQVLRILAEQLNSSVFILLILLGVAFVLTYKVSGWISNFKQSKAILDNFETTTKDFTINSTEKFAEISTKVDLIYQHVNPNIAVRSHSPMALTEVGKKMQKDMNATVIFNRIEKSEKAKILHSHQEKNAYDIQVACIEWSKKSSESLLTAEELDNIKKVAFNNGVLLEDVLAILGIMMRDNIFEELAILVADVNKHAPK